MVRVKKNSHFVLQEMSLKLEIIFRFSECYKIFFYRASVNQCEIPLFSGILLLLLHIVGGFSIN